MLDQLRARVDVEKEGEGFTYREDTEENRVMFCFDGRCNARQWRNKVNVNLIEIEEGSGNVYADLGMPDAGEMLIKARLAVRIGELIKNRRLTQQAAADVLGISQSKLSGLLRGQFRGISEAKMLECLNRLGQDVQITIRKAPRSHPTGQTNVIFA